MGWFHHLKASQKLLGIPVSLHPDIELTISIVQRLQKKMMEGWESIWFRMREISKNPNRRAKHGVWNASLLLVSPVHTLFQHVSTTIHKSSLATTVTATNIYIYIAIYICIHTIYLIVSMAYVYNDLIDIFILCFSISSMSSWAYHPLLEFLTTNLFTVDS